MIAIFFLKSKVISFIFIPSNLIYPYWGSNNLKIRLVIVDFPIPLFPMIATNWLDSIFISAFLICQLDWPEYLNDIFDN